MPYDLGGLEVRWVSQESWPGRRTQTPRRAPFRTKWTDVQKLLARELRMLGAERIVIEIAVAEKDFRIDGKPRADARASHDGIVMSFRSTWGPLRYATDAFDDWQDNIHAIAKSLEALRLVDRYGVSRHGEQYRGWKQLGSGVSQQPTDLSPEQAATLLAEEAGKPLDWRLVRTATKTELRAWYRKAARSAHPDHGGSDARMAAVATAYRVLGGEL
jgi:hypothetical protein